MFPAGAVVTPGFRSNSLTFTRAWKRTHSSAFKGKRLKQGKEDDSQQEEVVTTDHSRKRHFVLQNAIKVKLEWLKLTTRARKPLSSRIRIVGVWSVFMGENIIFVFEQVIIQRSRDMVIDIANIYHICMAIVSLYCPYIRPVTPGRCRAGK